MKKKTGILFWMGVCILIILGTTGLGRAVPLDCPTLFSLNLEPGAVFIFDGDTTGEPHNANNYNCTTWDEHGSEVVYRGAG